MIATIYYLQTVDIKEGANNCMQHIFEMLNGVEASASTKTYCISIQDHFDWWRQCNESDDSGKLLLVDTDNKNIIQMFFDDNIERDRAHIVDVRELNSFSRIPFETSRDLYIHKVHPYLAITDIDYFIKLIDRALSKLNLI